ncbi:putative methyltransferase [Gordonia hirsuta DSM 44140 = NBRC 16056]|uniref:Putative methyltransferase n=1 Tax=Gordonia hirsuta DSM 44140 = NBRC 16056 TaxID=1121927 RepID=L7LCG6_9ACTN|nr:class I SAM-dependent methyltransferase [Gordonia hirsuta]GAC58820.1 putative methyltransferase [Gordonia hirsuta DSM 44140 = NBRC 16056]
MSHDHGHDHHEHAENPHSAAQWDERYSSADRLWTAQVNPALAREAAGLTPGRALDVGSGEGADARWLADHGWTVVAVDISQVALDRAAEIDSRETIAWVKADLTVDEVPGEAFDLVALHYFPVDIDRGDVYDKLFAALNPGATLLVVAHDAEGIRAHGHDPDAYFQPHDVAERFADRLDVQILDTVERGRPAGASGEQRHMNDVVLKASKVS